MRYITCLLLPIIMLFSSCSDPGRKVDNPLFEVLDSKRTGLTFSNTLHPDPNFNVLDYMYYYNGGGIGAGDFNNDGRIDLFFASNQEENRLFLNTSSLHFRDVTAQAGIPQDKGWSTGVSVADVNNDGLLDIYVCKVGRLGGLPTTHNQLLICQGIDSNGVPIYKDEAVQYGVDFSGFSTQAAFFDYDGDGDLDLYLMNHSIHENGTFGPRKEKLATTNPYSGDRLYRNDGNGRFTDVTTQSGIHSSVIGYGLGITIADINLDGYPDIYIGNDFHENDYLYINDGKGHFTDESEQRIMHTSQFTMGVDVADANNDGYPDIISMDMLAYDPNILKRSLGENTWDIYRMKIGYGYSYQYTRNNLQLQRPDGNFSEIGLYSGVAATDWSWSPLWIDFDNDGLKDLFIANGIPKRLNDIDFINFLSDQQLQEQMHQSADKDIDLIKKFPEIKLPSKFYRNTGSMKFVDEADSISGSIPNYSNGAIYADLDNDGDLDLVVNSIDGPALIYRNNSNDLRKTDYIDVRLRGPGKNQRALGSKLILFSGKDIRTCEKYPVRGFMSSMDIPVHMGLGHTPVDSLFLVWPDNTFQRIDRHPGDTSLSLSWQPGLPRFDYRLLTARYTNPTSPVKDITNSTGLLYLHTENDFHEFDREPLLPHMLSTEGPALAVADINKDGLDDVFIGASKWQKNAIFLQQRSGTFNRVSIPALSNDSTYEDIDAQWADFNKDGNMDLVIASGGNEYYGKDTLLSPRLYLGDGKGHLTKLSEAFHDLYINASSVAVDDFNGDGFPDLFIGGRSVPWEYGKIPRSCLLRNDGKGHFTDVTASIAGNLSGVGLVTHACWCDLNRDGQKDLLLSLEWGGLVAFMNTHGHFVKKMITTKKGWWNFLTSVDIDNDGDMDVVAGNLGLNSRLTASPDQPVRMYYYDFDGNGKKEQLLTYYLNGKQLPFADKSELERQMPSLKKNFLYAKDFAKASLTDLFPIEKLSDADTLTADYFANAIFINDGHGNFTAAALPWQAQLSPYRDAAVADVNSDGLPDILLFGNYYENNIQMGRYDADYGTILLNKGKDSFDVAPLNGLAIKGQVRHILPLTIAGHPSFILARNNDSARIIRFTP